MSANTMQCCDPIIDGKIGELLTRIETLEAENKKLRSVVAVFEADEAKQPVDHHADAYCRGQCIAPKLRAAYQQRPITTEKP